MTMALIQRLYCDICEMDTQHVNGRCVDCEARKNRERIAAWNTLTPTEQIQDLRRRVEELERKPATY